MNHEVFERELRTLLDGLASPDVPRSLSARVGALRSTEPGSSRWFKRFASAAVGTIAVTLVVVLGAVAVLKTGWGSPTSGTGAEPKAFVWSTQMATLAADRLTVDGGGRTFVAPQDLDYINSDPGSATYRTLELAWHDGGTEMRLNFYFAADSTSWWIQHIRTYDGGEPGEWIYYLGPSFRMSLGESYAGNVDVFGLGVGGVGRLRIDGMTLSAFEPGTVPPAFDNCRAIGPTPANALQPVVSEIDPDLSQYGITVGMEAPEAGAKLQSQGICHEFRLEFPALNLGQIWCTAPPGKVRELRFGSSGEILVFVEDASRLPLDTELPQVVGC